jgi:hypothetical protein
MITITNYFYSYLLYQGFSTFWYSRTPQIMLNPLRVPLNKKLTQIVPRMKKWEILGTKKQNGLFSHRFESLLPSCNLLAYPLWTWGVPLGVRIPRLRIVVLYYLSNGTYEILSLKATDNNNRDHIKRLLRFYWLWITVLEINFIIRLD